MTTTVHIHNDLELQRALDDPAVTLIEVHSGVYSRIDSYEHPFGRVRIRGYRNQRWKLKPDGGGFALRLAHGRCAGSTVEDFDIDASGLDENGPATAIKITSAGADGSDAAEFVVLSNFRVRGALGQGLLVTSTYGVKARDGLIADCGLNPLRHAIYLGKGSRFCTLKNVSTLRPSGYGVHDYHGEEPSEVKTGHVIEGGWHVGSKQRSAFLIGGNGTIVRGVIATGNAQYGVQAYKTARNVTIEPSCDLAGNGLGEIYRGDPA